MNGAFLVISGDLLIVDCSLLVDVNNELAKELAVDDALKRGVVASSLDDDSDAITDAD